MDKKQKILRQYFGYTQFRGAQEELIDAQLSGRDVLGVMPTGGGKSLCYQIPGLLLPGLTLVISPLISLMQDQVLALKSAGVPAAYINSSLTLEQLRQVYRNLRQGCYKILYAAPERLLGEGFLAMAREVPISLVAVDEAHCISQWGQDFRPSYLKIPAFLEALPQRPVVSAYTATATPAVRRDILQYLGLSDPLVKVTDFDRPNLRFEVRTPESKQGQLLTLLALRKDKSGIVYCSTRKEVEAVCAFLQERNFAATRYHAGLSDRERQQNQEDFLFDRKTVMVATNAFGMGIDKPNVRFVIHYNMPRSMEAYYQEAGRAGRDGADAECVLLYSGSDIYTAKWMIEHAEPNPELTDDEREAVRLQDMRRLQAMIDYCTGDHCLRAYMLRYFGQSAPLECEGCSHCIGAQYGETEKLKRPSRRASSPAVRPVREQAGETPPADPDNLFEQLRACRLRLAQGLRVPPYIICDDKTLTDMVRRMPRSRDEMLSVHGMGTAKVGKWGDAFVRVIAAYAAAHPEGSAVKAAAVASARSRAWSREEESALREGYLNGVELTELARRHGRTVGAVRTRLIRLGLIYDGE